MPRFIALLRGINVGGHRVKMDHLRALFGEMGHTDIATFIASGNVIFSTTSHDPGALQEGIEEHLKAALSYEVPTLIRTPTELEAVASFEGPEDPRPEDSVYVMFTEEPVEDTVRAALEALASDTDRFEFRGREVYWLIRGKLSESPLFGGHVTKAMRGAAHTMRNITSVRKLVAKHGHGPE